MDFLRLVLLQAQCPNTNPQPAVIKGFNKTGHRQNTQTLTYRILLQNDQWVHSLVRGILNEATAWDIFMRNFRNNNNLDRYEKTSNLENGLNVPRTE
jgi:hypothetical protein